MANQNLPPQAYTKETVAQAYTWLQQQPEDIKQQAENTDTLVALFMRAKRNTGSAEQDYPVSSQNFRNDLKQLAGELNQFTDKNDTPPLNNVKPPSHTTPPTSPPPTPNTPPAPSQVPGFARQAWPESGSPNGYTQEVGNEVRFQFQKPTTTAQQPPPSVPLVNNTPSSGVSPKDLMQLLDSRSIQTILEVKERLNLSSETEVLRLLITMGKEKLSSILLPAD